MIVFNVVVGIATFLGLLFSIAQICKTRSAAEAAAMASTEIKTRVETSFLLPDIAVLIRHARTVKNDALNGHYEAARIRIQDLKDGLCRFEPSLNGDLRDYRKATSKIEMSMYSLEQCIQAEATLNYPMFSSDIEDVITVLNGIQNNVKEQAI